jgi:hypothetical protein
MLYLRMIARVLVGFQKREILCHLSRNKEIKKPISRRSKSKCLRRVL